MPHVDWASITYPVGTERVITWEPRSTWVPNAKGKLGYHLSSTTPCGAIVCEGGGNGDMGTHVIYSASALAETITRHKVHPAAILRDVYHKGGNASRIDVAIDVYDGSITPSYFIVKCQQGECTRVAKSPIHYVETAEGKGLTVYSGSRTSESYFRAYDKRAEQYAKGMAEIRLPLAWCRMEWEYKGKRAVDVGEWIATNQWSRVRRACVTTICPRTPSETDTNIDRWEPDKVYMRAIDGDIAARCRRPTIERDEWRSLAQYVERNLAGMIAAYVAGHPDGLAALERVVDMGNARRTPRQNLAVSVAPQPEWRDMDTDIGIERY